MNIRLNVINRSDSGHQNAIVLFQKDVLADIDELPLAWKVIRNCGRDCYHPFSYPMGFEISVSDSYGNHSPRVPVVTGQALMVTPTPTGRRLGPDNASKSSAEIQVVNALPRGSMDVNIYKAGLLMARKIAVAPAQKVVFQFTPTLWIGVASQIEQSQAVNSAVIQNVNTEIILLGFTSADIVMTGGGSAPNAEPFVFTLENMRST
jgi:hypothetical protein